MTGMLLAVTALTASAQNIDFDLPGKTAPGKDTEINYISWAVPRAESDTKTLDNGMTLTISAGGAASAVGSSWNKTDVETNGLRVIADEVLATNLEDGNLTQITDASTSLILTIDGMKAGEHTLKAYHNNSDKNQTQPDIEVSVNGTVVLKGVKFTSGAQSTVEAGTSFITFNVTEGQPVVITYTTVLEEGKTYTNARVMLNGLEFDAAAMVATDPQPANHDFHAGKEDGTVNFSWVAAPGATAHKLVLGTDSTQVATTDSYEYEGTAAEYAKTGLSSMQQYWWRVDEVDADGNGYTLLEEYMEFMAHPYIVVNSGKTETIDVKPFFIGFYGQNGNTTTPTYTVSTDSPLFTASVSESTVSARAAQTSGSGYINVTVDDGSTKFTQRIGVAVTGGFTGIYNLTVDKVADKDAPCYNLTGQRLAKPQRGLNIRNGRKFIQR